MRIYEGSPRQDWEEVLRSVGAFADKEQLKEILFLELEAGFILQGLALRAPGAHDEGTGSLKKQTYELIEDEVGRLVDERTAARTGTADGTPQAEIGNYYEQALRVLGAYVDQQRARDLFFFEQEGSFVLRTLVAGTGGSIGHTLTEFTRDEIMAMIESAPQHRQATSERARG
jgi:hypothetical protein